MTTDTKNRENRLVDLDPATAAALRELRKRQVAERLAFGPGYAEDGLLFVWADGSRVLPDYLSKEFMKAQARLLAAQVEAASEAIRRERPDAADAEVAKLAGLEVDRSGAKLPRLTLHGCRHSHACTLLRAGIPVHAVAARLGHKDPLVTLRALRPRDPVRRRSLSGCGRPRSRRLLSPQPFSGMLRSRRAA